MIPCPLNSGAVQTKTRNRLLLDVSILVPPQRNFAWSCTKPLLTDFFAKKARLIIWETTLLVIEASRTDKQPTFKID